MRHDSMTVRYLRALLNQSGHLKAAKKIMTIWLDKLPDVQQAASIYASITAQPYSTFNLSEP